MSFCAFTPNYDESKVPEYTLTDPLQMNDGQKVDSVEKWNNKRRPELLELFATEMFGKTPKSSPIPIRFELQSEKTDALNGKAIRREIRVFLTQNQETPYLDLLIYTPKNATTPAPGFLVLNFQGNHGVTDEPGIKPCESLIVDPKFISMTDDGKRQEIEQLRGVQKDRWPVEFIIDRGYAFVTLCYYDIDPDFDDGFQNGVQPLFYTPGQKKPAPDEWGAIGAWAWGLSKTLDYLETDPLVDAAKIAVMGHSRLGKTALWAGAQDERFAMVISNNSGCGGAALSRRAFGETVARINTVFPHWFCENFKKYNDREADLPFDQHELIALIAPRPVYVASAEEDQWADPKGEFLAALNADSVYRLLGTDGMAGVTEMPPLNQSVGGRIHYHCRTGKHDVTLYDWEQYLDFADKYFE